MAQEETRVEHGEDAFAPTPVKPLSPEFAHGLFGSKEVSGRNASKGYDNRRVDNGDLGFKVGETRLDLFKGRGSVSRWAAFDHVGNVHFLPLYPHREKDFRKELSCLSNKRSSGTVFIFPRCFADEHEKGIGIAFPKNHLGPALGKGTESAPLYFSLNFLKKRCFLLPRQGRHGASPIDFFSHCTTCVFRDFDELIPVAVHDPGIEKFHHRIFIDVIKVHMAMEMVLGVVLSENTGECCKSPVGEILPFVNSLGRRMGYKDIKVSPVPEMSPVEFRQETKVFPVHLTLGVLVSTPIVPVAALKTGKKDTPVEDNLLVEVRSSG